jgi:hypothetical protein
MKVAHSRNRPVRTPDSGIAAILREVSSDNLRAVVETLAFPRNYVATTRSRTNNANTTAGRGTYHTGRRDSHGVEKYPAAAPHREQ